MIGRGTSQETLHGMSPVQRLVFTNATEHEDMTVCVVIDGSGGRAIWRLLVRPLVFDIPFELSLWDFADEMRNRPTRVAFDKDHNNYY